MSLHNGIDTCAFVSLGLYTKIFGATSPIIEGGRPYISQASINSLFVSLGLLEGAPPGKSSIGGWHRWPNVILWPWRKFWKVWG